MQEALEFEAQLALRLKGQEMTTLDEPRVLSLEARK